MCGSVYVCLCANSTIGCHPMAVLKKDDFIAIKNGLGYSQAILGYSFICMFFFLVIYSVRGFIWVNIFCSLYFNHFMSIASAMRTRKLNKKIN